MHVSRLLSLIALAVFGALPATSQSNDSITPASIVMDGAQHLFDQAARIDPEQVAKHYKRDRDCTGVCIAPMQISQTIATIGEHEVIDFVSNQVVSGKGLLLDARPADDRSSGTIAGAVNVPRALLEPDNPFLSEILVAMGGTAISNGINGATLLPVIVFDDGPSSSEASDMIKALRNVGYPDSKIRYYRGGMMAWTTLGLRVDEP